MVKTFEEWAASSSDPGTVDYLEYLANLIDTNAAEIVKAKQAYIAICKRDGIDIPMELYTGPFIGP